MLTDLQIQEHWKNYAIFCRDTINDTEKAKNVLQRATAIIYLDPRCKALWEMLIDLETEDGNHSAVGNLYSQVLTIPVTYVEDMLKRFKQWASTDARVPEDVCPDNNDKLIDAKGEVDADENYTEKTEDEKEKAVVQKLITAKEEMAQDAISAAERRKKFEALISKRTYYHVNPLDGTVLSAWHDYLDSEESEGNPVS